jgi:hypothetical protein
LGAFLCLLFEFFGTLVDLGLDRTNDFLYLLFSCGFRSLFVQSINRSLSRLWMPSLLPREPSIVSRLHLPFLPDVVCDFGILGVNRSHHRYVLWRTGNGLIDN